MLNRTLLLATFVAGVLVAAPAMAGPMAPLKAETPTADSLIVPVHGCHPNVQWGPFGYHFHGPGCQRISAGRPRPRYIEPAPRYYPYRPRPACFQECNYIGPIRQCRTVCR